MIYTYGNNNYTSELDMVIFYLPMNIEVDYGYQLVTGPIKYFVYISIALSMLFNVYLVIKNSKTIKDRRYLSVHAFNIFIFVLKTIALTNPEIPHIPL